MAINLTCLRSYPAVPLVPIIANESTASVHPSYKPDSGGLTQVISGSLARSTFSINDVESLLKDLFDKDSDTWNNISEITKRKPIPSIIIYSSIALALFLILSITFCVISCRKPSKSTSEYRRKRQPSKCTNVCVCLLIIVYLLGIGDMIYVAYRVNKSKVSIDDTIKEVNRDIYPKEISEHIQYITKQFEKLDQYCIRPDSILINASKSILVKTFDGILTEKYLVNDIVTSVNRIDTNMKELKNIVDKEMPENVKDLFEKVQQRYINLTDNLKVPLQEVCNYANGTQNNIDKKFLQALDTVHQEIRKVNDTINKNILNEITPWQNHLLIDTDTEEQIRGYFSIAGNIFLVFVILLAVIPLGFCLVILLCRVCSCGHDRSFTDNLKDIRMGTVVGTPVTDYAGSNSHYRRKSSDHRSSRVSPNPQRERSSRKESFSNSAPSGVPLCLMRIAFAVMIIMLIVLVLLTGAYYALDLFLQGACRTVHDDQQFLVPFITDKVIGTNDLFVNSTDMSTTVMNMINDCRDKVHFTRQLAVSYWSTLDRYVTEMVNDLNKQIYDEFIYSTGKINIPEDINYLTNFDIAANRTDVANRVQQIVSNLRIIDKVLENITNSEPTLPKGFVQTTITTFNGYIKEVLESTIDGCPLPLATIYKTDILVCHTLAGSLSGLWLSVFLLMFLVIAGLCIFGLCVYKRLNRSSGSISPDITSF